MVLRKFVVLFVTLCLILPACVLPVRTTQIRGSGNVITETRQVNNFNRLELTGIGTLIIFQGEEEGLEISAEDNILSKIQTHVVGNTLEIGFDEFINISPTEEITYQLKVKNLESISTSGIGNIQADVFSGENLTIEISGVGSMNIKQLTANELDVQISGSGNFDLAGKVTNQEVRLSGFGNYRAGDLRSEDAQIEISGTGNAIIWVTNSMEIDISGLGSLDYFGNPLISQEVSGLGKVTALGEK